MTRILVILFILFAGADLLSAAASPSISESSKILGPGGAIFTPGTDTKKVEDNMAEALDRLESWKKARAEEKRALPVNREEQTRANSTLNNTSFNSSLNNSSLLNSSAAMVADANKLDANGPAGGQNVGSSTRGSFNGFYGLTASRHELSKSGINSRMLLSGNFEMDKTVKFQDRGI